MVREKGGTTQLGPARDEGSHQGGVLHGTSFENDSKHLLTLFNF